MKKKRYYYQFWIQSSRGTDNTIVRMYDKPQTKESLKQDCEDWCSGFGAWVVSENVIHYGWKPIHKLPKNREECLSIYRKAWKHKNKWSAQTRLFGGLLSHPPFNGQK